MRQNPQGYGCHGPKHGVHLLLSLIHIFSNVLKGSGISSSAAYEVLVGTVINALYCENKLTPVEIAQIGQYAENVYFGKMSGLMDQTASSVGGVVAIDFRDNANPIVRKLDFDFTKAGYALCIIDSGADHADLDVYKRQDVLCVNMVDAKAASGVVEKASAAGIPTIFFNREPDTEVIKSYDKARFIGTNAIDAGKMQGDIIKDLWDAHPEYDLNGDGKVQYVMFQGEPDNPEAIARTQYSVEPVSYTHLDVYKRQAHGHPGQRGYAGLAL